MRFWILLFGAIGLAACGDGDIGDDCDEDDDCEEGLFCDLSAETEDEADGDADDPEGLCAEPGDTGSATGT